nr:MAG TPA: hypothetical protein [Caudoviricetes sp.]
MNYAPHTLYLKNTSGYTRDEYGRPVAAKEETWEAVCKCRCDDDTTTKLVSENGITYDSKYHVVCERNIAFKGGEEVRCMEGERVRGEGVVAKKPRNCNYFGYGEFWI